MKKDVYKSVDELREKAQHGAEVATKKAKDVWGHMHGWGNWSSVRELGRAIFHASFGLIAWFLIEILRVSVSMVWTLLISIGFAVFGLDSWRLWIQDNHGRLQSGGWFDRLQYDCNKWANKYLMRESEKKSMATIRQSVIGLTIAWAIFTLTDNVWMAPFSSLFFSLVDPMGKFGKREGLKIHRFESWMWKGKSVGGSLFALSGGFIAIAIVVWSSPYGFFPTSNPGLVVLTGVVGAIMAVIAELVGKKWDNLTIPAVSALSMVLFWAAVQ